jgi:putative aminopeptidase FrvX
MKDMELLEKLCTARGVSGSEDEVRDIILKEITPYADRVDVTPLGNIVAFKKGRDRAATRLMLNAHMDEVGLIVTCITDSGLLKFDAVGGIDPRVLPGTGVTVGAGIPGVIGIKPIHLLEAGETEKRVPMKELYIDIGADSRGEAEKAVKPGDVCVFDSVFDTSRGMVKSRALDDRAGCAILIHLLRGDLKYDATFVFAVQEEVGLNGSRTAAYGVEPEAAIVVESTTASDVARVKRDEQVCRLGEGAVISFMDRRTIYDREYCRMAFDAAREAGAACQAKEAVAGGNDAGAIHVSRGGVRTVAVSLPCRYLHSPVGMIAQRDYESAEKIIGLLSERISGGISYD